MKRTKKMNVMDAKTTKSGDMKMKAKSSNKPKKQVKTPIKTDRGDFKIKD